MQYLTDFTQGSLEVKWNQAVNEKLSLNQEKSEPHFRARGLPTSLKQKLESFQYLARHFGSCG